MVSDGVASIETDSSEQDVSSFLVNGVEQLGEQEFLMNFGLHDVQDAELFDTMTLMSATQDEDTNTIVAVFEGSGIRFTITYVLNGSVPSPYFDATALIQNIGSSGPLDLTVLDYTDWDVDGDGAGDVATYIGGGIFEVVDEETTARSQAFTVFDFFEVENCCENWSGGDLSNDAGPIGPDDIEVTFEYNLTIAQASSATVRSRHSILDAGPTHNTAPLLSPAVLAALAALLFAAGTRASRSTPRRDGTGRAT